MDTTIKIQCFVNTIFSSVSYIIYHENYHYCYLIDCGDYLAISDWLKLNSKIVSGVFITHTHFDHIYGLNILLIEFPHCFVYTSNEGKKGLYSSKLNFSRYHDSEFIFKFEERLIKILLNNQEIELFPQISMKVIETPGHDWSCLSYIVDNNIFTGDSYIPTYKVITSFPKSDRVLADTSYKIILEFVNQKFNVYAGHKTLS